MIDITLQVAPRTLIIYENEISLSIMDKYSVFSVFRNEIGALRKYRLSGIKKNEDLVLIGELIEVKSTKCPINDIEYKNEIDPMFEFKLLISYKLDGMKKSMSLADEILEIYKSNIGHKMSLAEIMSGGSHDD